jgi:hypothetical protein
MINYRDNISLSLRKNKIDKEVMQRRIIEHKFDEEFKELQIRLEHLNLPDDINREFDDFDEKYHLIAQYLEREDDYFKFGVYKLKELSQEYEDYNDEGIDLPYDIFTYVILILENSNDNIILVSIMI